VFGYTTDGTDDFAPKHFRATMDGTNAAMRWFEAIPDLASAIPCLGRCLTCCCAQWETHGVLTSEVAWQTIPLNDVVRGLAPPPR